ncbi:uncharacterized protein LOC142661630 [Rhinoderma darwinii]|uniref:uncharacterized protein LOC142661630 n=1 Tax=Rhinoderma darwinii TaxID=43563 RepID=UPI003F6716CD
MYLWRIVSFLSALATTGYCLQCTTCSDFNSDACMFSTVTACPDGNVCASRYRISVIGEIIFQNFDRFCAQPSECNVTGTLAYSYSILERMGTTCCSENLCTPAKPIAPDGSSELNGIKCLTCSLSILSSCNMLNCKGDQTMCLLETSKQTTGSQTVTSIHSGCAAEGLCYKKNESSTAGTVYTETTYSCTRGTNGGSSASHTTTSAANTVLFSAGLLFIGLLMQNNV